MAESKYGKYIISNPSIATPFGTKVERVKGVTFPKELFMNTGLAKGCPTLVDIGWHFAIPDPDPVVPVSNWAIILGVLLIGAFIVVRYRTRLA